jgi:hypothetical protein
MSVTSNSGATGARVEELFRRVRASFDAKSAEIKTPQLVDGTLSKTFTKRMLRNVDVPFSIDSDVCYETSCGLANVTSLCDCNPDFVSEVAEYSHKTSLLWGYKQHFRVFLAFVDNPKMLRHSRCLKMRDINSGVTFFKESLVIMFRRDSDFWKVLVHELTHLMRNEMDESKTEFLALLVHTMILSSDMREFERLLKAQQRLSHRVAKQLESVDVGTTNAALYWDVGGVCMLDHAEDVLAGRNVEPSTRKHQRNASVRDAPLRVSL